MPSKVNCPGHAAWAALTNTVALGTEALGHMYFRAKSSALDHRTNELCFKSTITLLILTDRLYSVLLVGS